ncbi:unnamed protein product [Lactuca saligna]|uniref:ClpA/ClpB AAA lid domain-containing protein n=1 Tax=Lactuca saligna TaxID=75948 RepID=A0AA35ZQY2_LACSI|nr:unnamed protein product [Lactuca saligna]
MWRLEATLLESSFVPLRPLSALDHLLKSVLVDLGNIGLSVQAIKECFGFCDFIFLQKLRVKEGKKVESASGDTNFQALKTYSRDFVEQAWKLDPVIGRYTTARFLPDKAIDLVDEACANVRVQLDS